MYVYPPLHQTTLMGQALTWRAFGHGTKTPVVLLHGIGSNAGAWAGQFEALGVDRPVIAWNAPGYGGSDPLGKAWPVGGDYALALARLLDHLGFDQVTLVGQSLGAIMAVAFAKLWPQRVSELVLASPANGYGVIPGGVFPQGVQARLDDLVALGPQAFAETRYKRLLAPRASDVAHQIVRRAMSEVTLEGYRDAVHLLAVSHLEAEVEALSVKPLVLCGTEDVVTPSEACRRIAARAGVALVEVPGGGHAFASECPAAFNSLVRLWLHDADETLKV